jgi:hypothetical protein
MLALKAEEEQRFFGPDANPDDSAVAKAIEGFEQRYDTDRSRAQLLAKLQTKHGIRSDR